MMKYSFGIERLNDPLRPDIERLIPYVKVDNAEQYGDFFVDEIRNLSVDYLEKIVPALEKVLNGNLAGFEFGCELYNFECGPKNCNVTNNFEGGNVESTLPTKDMYQLVRDWRRFLQENNV